MPDQRAGNDRAGHQRRGRAGDDVTRHDYGFAPHGAMERTEMTEDEFEFVPAEEADSGMVAGGEGPLKVGAYPVDRDGERLWRRVRRA